MIQNENDRLRTRMIQNGAFTDSYNNYVPHRYVCVLFQLISFLFRGFSLNFRKRHRDEIQHRNVIERLQKQINHVRTNYSTREYEYDYAHQQDFKRQITRFPPIKNK